MWLFPKTRASLEELHRSLNDRLNDLGEEVDKIRAEQEKVAKGGDAVVARFEARVTSVEFTVGAGEMRIAEAAKELSERCDGGLARLREQGWASLVNLISFRFRFCLNVFKFARFRHQVLYKIV